MLLYKPKEIMCVNLKWIEILEVFHIMYLSMSIAFVSLLSLDYSRLVCSSVLKKAV